MVLRLWCCALVLAIANSLLTVFVFAVANTAILRPLPLRLARVTPTANKFPSDGQGRLFPSRPRSLLTTLKASLQQNNDDSNIDKSAVAEDPTGFYDMVMERLQQHWLMEKSKALRGKRRPLEPNNNRIYTTVTDEGKGIIRMYLGGYGVNGVLVYACPKVPGDNLNNYTGLMVRNRCFPISGSAATNLVYRTTHDSSHSAVLLAVDIDPSAVSAAIIKDSSSYFTEDYSNSNNDSNSNEYRRFDFFCLEPNSDWIINKSKTVLI